VAYVRIALCNFLGGPEEALELFGDIMHLREFIAWIVVLDVMWRATIFDCFYFK
jgi:hypothetical protein